MLSASRVMVAVAARSLAGLDADVTLAQFRTLIVLAARGPQRVVDVSAELGVNPSTGTRMCDRLVRKGLIRRARTTGDRRVIRLTLTPAGRDLVAEVNRQRRKELSRLAARAGVTTAFLTPGGDVAERVYARVGYRGIGDMLHIWLPG